MKHRISISIDEELFLEMRDFMRNKSIFRNRSHVIEHALKELIGRKE